MPTLTCKRCETEFSTEREPPAQGADTRRCPSCGKLHRDVPEPEPASRGDGGRTETTTVVITIEVIGDATVRTEQR